MSTLRAAFAAFIAIHALIHLLGPAKAFGWAEVTQLRAPISPASGALWLLAAVLLLAAAVGFALDARWWWFAALSGLVVSQAMIISVWPDATCGTIATILIAIPTLIAALDARPSSFRSRFEAESTALLAREMAPAELVTEADLARLPALMQQYLRNGGAVGRPRIHNFRLTFSAQMRGSATDAWMQSTATQYEFFDPPVRLFHMTASKVGVPFDVFHRYAGNEATFQVRVAGVIPMVNKRGPGITHDETVTLMNDVLVLAPAALLDLAFEFEVTGDRTLRATFHNAGFTVSADLTFNAAGDLVGFVSAARSHDREGGPALWSTPISGYREVDGIRLGTLGDANWIEASGEEWTYGRFEVMSIAYNVTR